MSDDQQELEAKVEQLRAQVLDTTEGEEPSAWEERFETQINMFFDEAIARVPGFVDRHLRNLRRTMGRSLAPKTGLGDIVVSLRNLAAGVTKSVGGPDFSTTTYTHDQLTEAFEREVVSSEELESLLKRLFAEFEEAQWSNLTNVSEDVVRAQEEADIDALRNKLVQLMEKDIAHDPLLAQAIRSGVKIGLPATLGYILFGRATFWNLGAEAASEIYTRNLNLYHKVLHKLGRFQVPTWVGAVGLAGGLVGTLAVGGVMEYVMNSLRDVKGYYIRQLNTARYVLLYGENPELAEGQGILHLVRGLERQFERLPELTEDVLEQAEQDVRAGREAH